MSKSTVECFNVYVESLHMELGVVMMNIYISNLMTHLCMELETLLRFNSAEHELHCMSINLPAGGGSHVKAIFVLVNIRRRRRRRDDTTSAPAHIVIRRIWNQTAAGEKTRRLVVGDRTERVRTEKMTSTLKGITLKGSAELVAEFFCECLCRLTQNRHWVSQNEHDDGLCS